MYKHPGVYIEHLPSGLLAIEAASTSTAAFIGAVARGPVNKPVLVLSRGEFARKFGEVDDSTSGIRNLDQLPDHFGFAVNSFYDNGGKQAYILRVAKGARKARAALADPTATLTHAFYLSADSEGVWGNKLVAELAPVAVGAPDLGYDLRIGYLDAQKKLVVIESFSGVSPVPGHPRDLVKVLEQSSDLVDCQRAAIGTLTDPTGVKALRGGDLNGLDYDALKSKEMSLTVNGTVVKAALASNRKDLSVTYAPSAANVTKVHTAPAAIADIDALALALGAALKAHPELAQLRVEIDAPGHLVLVPPANISGTAQITAVSGVLATALKLTAGEGAAALDKFPAPGMAQFFNGSDGDPVGAADYDTALATLRDYRDASIIVLPGAVWDGADKVIIDKAITHAEFMLNRMVIVDPKSTFAVADRLGNATDVRDRGFPTSSFSALYYPWMEVVNPHYDPELRANLPRSFLVAPSGFAAGMWARIDGTRGVWKAPAGLEASVRGSLGPSILIGNDLQDQLNDWGVNCIRSIIGPPVIWGARSLATRSQPDQRYVPVRRTSILIGESLYNALQAVVFEPNKHILWASLRASASDFMDGLFRAGAFQGERASDAYYVQCGLDVTMTQGDVDAGIVRLVVGYAPLKPAEFVVVQIKQIVGQRG